MPRRNLGKKMPRTSHLLKFHVKCKICAVMWAGSWALVNLPGSCLSLCAMGRSRTIFVRIKAGWKRKVSQAILLIDVKLQNDMGLQITVFWATLKGHGSDWIWAKFKGSCSWGQWVTCQPPEWINDLEPDRQCAFQRLLVLILCFLKNKT